MRARHYIFLIIQLLLGWKIIFYFVDLQTLIFSSTSRDYTCKRHDCQRHGTCLIGKCFCQPDYEGIDCESKSNRSIYQSFMNDDRQYYHPLYGVGEVLVERWKIAVLKERSVWKNFRFSNDRWNDHLDGFANYKMLPNDLGNMLEIGCGPYTQTLSILLLKNKRVNITHLTLWDPNAKYYIHEVKNCQYKSGTLRGFEHIPTVIISLPSEEIHSYINRFDTVLMINVLEHVQNAYQILQNLYNTLKNNGTLIFAERWWDQIYEGKNYEYDILHPIRIKYYVWKWFTDHFISIYDVRNHESYLKHGYNGSYFIGKKKIKS